MGSLKETKLIEEKKTKRKPERKQLPEIRPVDRKVVNKKPVDMKPAVRKEAVKRIELNDSGKKSRNRFLDFIRNKYAVGSAILLIVIITLVVIALKPPVTHEEETVVDESGDVIYIIDAQGNKIEVPATEDDTIVMQNEKEVEDPTVLAYNANTREGYMNNCVFLGDSRTVAMVSYGYISDSNALAKVGISHWQVMSTTFTQNSGNRYTLTDYLRAHSEPVIYVCYGVNGMNGLDEEKYKKTYEELVDRIVSLAGDRKIVLMSIWPVDDNGRYKGSVKNEWVDKYNTFLFDMAKEKGLYYLNIAPILRDESGNIKKEYDSGDGLHYKSSAYKDILDFIIHHPVPGVSDEGEFVVHYVKPKGEYKDIMTETPTLPQNTQIEADDYTFVIPTFMPGAVPATTDSQEGTQPAQGFGDAGEGNINPGENGAENPANQENPEAAQEAGEEQRKEEQRKEEERKEEENENQGGNEGGGVSEEQQQQWQQFQQQFNYYSNE